MRDAAGRTGVYRLFGAERARAWLTRSARAAARALCCVPLLAPAWAQSASGGPASDADAPAHSSWANLVIRYAAVTLICVIAFTLIFLKCWKDLGDGAAREDPETADPDAVPDEEESPVEENDSVAAEV